MSARDLAGSAHPRLTRSTSMSPSMQRRRRESLPTRVGVALSGGVVGEERRASAELEGRVVRVAFTNSNQINYKSLKVSVNIDSFDFVPAK